MDGTLKKILLLEDDRELGDTLQELLEDAGYDVMLTRNGEEAIDASYEEKFDLYVFDINLPDMQGTDLLESLRDADDRTPTIFISALSDIKSIARGFEVGADDYIKKPFMPEELLIRINAKLAQSGNDDVIKVGDIEYDPNTRSVKKSAKLISLGEVHTALLHELLVNRNSVVDKLILLDLLEHPSDAALRVAINKLKKVTGIEIKNIRGVGYTVEV